MGDRGRMFENVVNIVLVVVAVMMGGAYLLDRRPPTPPGELDWEREMRTGLVTGPDNAPMKIVEFIDFQCPACGVWSTWVDSVMAEYPGAVQVSLHHLPITSLHPHALEAAVAVECADRQGKARELARGLFSKEILVGVKAWRDFAAEAAIEDLDAFDRCVAMPPDSFPRIGYGIQLAEEIGVTATPSVWINGERRRPSPQQMRDLVEVLIAR